MTLRSVAYLALVACGSVTLEPPPDGSPDVVPDATFGPDAPVVDCTTDPSPCLYRPTSYPIETSTSAFADPTRVGGTRQIPYTIRFAPTAPRPMPVVILSHGGASGHTSSETSLAEWATIIANAGYFSISLAHVPRTAEEREALCALLGFDAAGCATFKPLSYDRPLDISRMIDRATTIAGRPDYLGMIDTTKIAVVGHSAGAGGALMIAGAPRDMNGPVEMEDPRATAFAALSPQAPGSDGFDAAGYGHVERPTLIATGRGDENPPDTADARASVFDLIQPGEKARLFIEDPAAIHTLFGGALDPCAARASLERCEEMFAWLRSALLAFLDTHLRASTGARAYLESTMLSAASANAAEWSLR